jgi:hypothetical protein
MVADTLSFGGRDGFINIAYGIGISEIYECVQCERLIGCRRGISHSILLESFGRSEDLRA